VSVRLLIARETSGVRRLMTVCACDVWSPRDAGLSVLAAAARWVAAAVFFFHRRLPCERGTERAAKHPACSKRRRCFVRSAVAAATRGPLTAGGRAHRHPSSHNTIDVVSRTHTTTHARTARRAVPDNNGCNCHCSSRRRWNIWAGLGVASAP